MGPGDTACVQCDTSVPVRRAGETLARILDDAAARGDKAGLERIAGRALRRSGGPGWFHSGKATRIQCAWYMVWSAASSRAYAVRWRLRGRTDYALDAERIADTYVEAFARRGAA